MKQQVQFRKDSENNKRGGNIKQSVIKKDNVTKRENKIKFKPELMKKS